MSVTYLHNAQHPAMRCKRAWVKSEIMGLDNLEWPEVKPGDQIVCGTCGQPFEFGQMRPPFLVLEEYF